MMVHKAMTVTRGYTEAPELQLEEILANDRGQTEPGQTKTIPDVQATKDSGTC